MKPKFQFYSWEGHHRLIVSSCVALIVFFVFSNKLDTTYLFMASWTSFALTTLLLMWIVIIAAHPANVHATAKLQDSSRVLIFVFVLVSACASLFAIILLLKPILILRSQPVTLSIVLSVVAVISSWLLVHTLFTMRYAHLYYEHKAISKDDKSLGLQFPEDENPDYMDFAYFSFVIGMTCQVSDVQIVSKKIRRMALLHGLITFGFNTIIVALTINIISGLLSR
jgi:uncharacterized membrane protein